jgi:hypothetical protein
MRIYLRGCILKNYAVLKGNESIKPHEPQPSTSDISKTKQLGISEEASALAG